MSSTRLVTRVLVSFAAALTALSLSACSSLVAEDVTVPDELVAPGSTVKVGQTVRVPGKAKANGVSSETEVGMTITAVETKDASLFEKFENASDFAGMTPIAVSTQVNLPDDADDSLKDPTAAPVFGVLADGTYTEYLAGENGESDADGDICYGAKAALVPSSDVDISCHVLLVPKGGKLTAIKWDGTWNPVPADANGSKAPYLAKPLTITQ